MLRLWNAKNDVCTLVICSLRWLLVWQKVKNLHEVQLAQVPKEMKCLHRASIKTGA